MPASEAVVVDTDVLSFLFKGHPLAPPYETILADRPQVVSLISIAEIENGMAAKNWGINRRDLMRRFLSAFTVACPDRETAVIWAEVRVARARLGRPIDFSDAWIAAAALQSAVPLVTHNARHFSNIDGLEVITAQNLA